jgi:hypothetical protein
MEEVFPVLAGIVLGLVTHALRRGLKGLAIAIASPGLGTLAAWISGELSVSWGYLLIDTIQVAVAAVMTGVLVSVWLRRRRTRLSARG